MFKKNKNKNKRKNFLYQLNDDNQESNFEEI
jgi:hypothetical protein